MNFIKQTLSPEFKDLTTKIGVYALCDLDGVVVYVGMTAAPKIKGIKGRVGFHATIARTDVVANGQLDPWELAFVRFWSGGNGDNIELIRELERRVYAEYKDTIIAGREMRPPEKMTSLPPFSQVRIITEEEVGRRKDPKVRLKNQLEHTQHLFKIIITRKDSPNQRRSLDKHMRRVQQWYNEFIDQ